MGQLRNGGWGRRREAGNSIPLLELLDACYPALSVADHFGEEVGEAGLAELGRLGAVQWAVVDGFAIGWVPQARLLLAACCLAGP